MPPTEGVHCWYAAAWVQVKTRWNLTVDQAETDTLRSVLADCDDIDLSNLPEAQTVAEEITPAEAEAEAEPVNACHPAYEPCLPNRPGDATQLRGPNIGPETRAHQRNRRRPLPA